MQEISKISNILTKTKNRSYKTIIGACRLWTDDLVFVLQTSFLGDFTVKCVDGSPKTGMAQNKFCFLLKWLGFNRLNN